MAGSLQDQLLKAGLTNEKKAKKAQKSSKKSRELKRAVKASTEQQKLEQQQRDKQLNQQINEQAKQKAIQAQIKQLIEMNMQPSGGSEIYKFVDKDNKIKEIAVSELQRNQLIAGVLSIVAFGNSIAIIPSVVANKISLRDDSVLISCADPEENQSNEDDPYADYVVPDDLMW